MRVAVSLLTITIVLAQDSPKPNLNSFDLEAINKDVRPCDDFYEHAIGRWHAQHPIPASQVRWGKRWAAAEYNRDVLRDLVETVAAKSSTGNTNERLIGTYFNACMNTKTIDALGNKPIQPALERIRLAFTREALKSEIAKFAAEDIPLFALMSATPDSDQPDRMILGIYASPLGLPDRDYYLKDDAKAKADRERYSKHLAKMFELAGLDPAKSSTVLQLETELAKSQLSRVERRNPYNVKNYMSPQQLADLAPAFPWAELFRSTGTAPGSVLNVMDKKYLERANQMLATAPLDDLKTMLAWQVIRFRGNA
ncbi:MAG TPA: M13 family metallopeptidase N-terminal domain-containing protein, partial [Bryobacteraceae bacterium]|nr:M13 family metallopeptidase N-terminal domain-containing protein [Bryobacteraceae bacterium]